MSNASPRRYVFAFALLLIAALSTAKPPASYKVVSFDKRTAMEVSVREKGQLMYRIIFSGNEVIRWSPMGMVINAVPAGTGTTILKDSISEHHETFNWPLGENDRIENAYREVILQCRSSSIKFNVIARVFNGSVAFRYLVPQQPGIEDVTISKENTAFNFTAPQTIYQYHFES